MMYQIFLSYNPLIAELKLLQEARLHRSFKIRSSIRGFKQLSEVKYVVFRGILSRISEGPYFSRAVEAHNDNDE